MIVQIHHQFKNGETKFCGQKNITGDFNRGLDKFRKKLAKSHPLQGGAKWLICSNKSKDFVETKK